MSTILERITSPVVRSRFETLCKHRPDLQTLSYILGWPRVLEWVLSVGVAKESDLASLGPPIPPLELRQLTAEPAPEIFLWTGLHDLVTFLDVFSRNGGSLSLEGLSVLDFGCGCGRMLRYLNDGIDCWEVYGADINSEFVDWCQTNLPNVNTTLSQASPPLSSYHDEQFHLIYSLSLLTHLPEASSEEWLGEFHRMLVPGGMLIVTTSGEIVLEAIKNSEIQQSSFFIDRARAIEILEDLPHEGIICVKYPATVLEAAKAGAEYGNTFIHPDYVKKRWNNRQFEVLEASPSLCVEGIEVNSATTEVDQGDECFG